MTACAGWFLSALLCPYPNLLHPSFVAYNTDLYGLVKLVLCWQSGFGQWGVLKKNWRGWRVRPGICPLDFLSVGGHPPSILEPIMSLNWGQGGISQAAVMAFVTTSPLAVLSLEAEHTSSCRFSGFPTFFPQLCKLSMFPKLECVIHFLQGPL